MLDIENLIEPEWLDWYRKTPEERLQATGQLWKNYREMGGSLDPDVDAQSPFWSRDELAGFAKNAAATPSRAFPSEKVDD